MDFLIYSNALGPYPSCLSSNITSSEKGSWPFYLIIYICLILGSLLQPMFHYVMLFIYLFVYIYFMSSLIEYKLHLLTRYSNKYIFS